MHEFFEVMHEFFALWLFVLGYVFVGTLFYWIAMKVATLMDVDCEILPFVVGYGWIMFIPICMIGLSVYLVVKGMLRVLDWMAA